MKIFLSCGIYLADFMFALENSLMPSKSLVIIRFVYQG